MTLAVLVPPVVVDLFATQDGAHALSLAVGIWVGLAVIAVISRWLRPRAQRRVAVALLAALLLSAAGIARLGAAGPERARPVAPPAPRSRVIAMTALIGPPGSRRRPIGAADDGGGFVILDPCKGLTPSDWQWWAYGCMWP